MYNFSEALERIKNGEPALRYAHNIEFKHIIHNTYLPFKGLYVVLYDDTLTPYTPSYDDLMAEDWYVPGEKTV
jgi:hypothetical protein